MFTIRSIDEELVEVTLTELNEKIIVKGDYLQVYNIFDKLDTQFTDMQQEIFDLEKQLEDI